MRNLPGELIDDLRLSGSMNSAEGLLGSISNSSQLDGNIIATGSMSGSIIGAKGPKGDPGPPGPPGPPGTTDYLDLTNKPSIENVTLVGNISFSDFGTLILDCGTSTTNI